MEFAAQFMENRQLKPVEGTERMTQNQAQHVELIQEKSPLRE
jgi:hypothetical protein